MSDHPNFQLQRDLEIPELRIRARLYRHRNTGARLLSLSNDDENKVFGITFRTPPTDSTGVAHILEHAVLCGSRKYPSKEPFVELLKGSLQTFLNAMTYPDKTCYPVASQNRKDFYHLIDVYLDAVLYPRLTPAVFQQEGWHYELEDLSGPLSFKGVVFNEMKGAFSSPDNVLGDSVLQSLFPNTAYGLISGGDPKVIPNLTLELFRSFHRRFYHPSNAFVWFYGDDDPEERLAFLQGYLADFEPLAVPSSVPPHPPFSGPSRCERCYMVSGAETASSGRGMATVNWVLAETSDVRQNFALRALEHILLGTSASPLRKALIDSGLGEDLAGEGLGTELRQLYFSSGLKGVRVAQLERVEELLLETLGRLVQKGLDRGAVDAALNTLEFRLRENNTGRFPRGLALMLRSLTTWLHDADPFALLAFEEPLQALKRDLASGTFAFEEFIRDRLLDNPHRSSVLLKPDPELRLREEAAEQTRLAEARSAMGEDDLRVVLETTRELRRLQETPDPPEALASIPRLELADLARENPSIPCESAPHLGTRLLRHELFTNGIVYLDLGLDLRSLPAEYLPYIPLFGRALLETGTAREDFVTLTQRITRLTGGIVPQTLAAGVTGAETGAVWLFLRGKAVAERAGDLIHILRDVLLSARLDDGRRLQQMILEEKARLEHELVPMGHQMVSLRLRSVFSEALWAAEQMGGLSQLFFLRELAGGFPDSVPETARILKEIRERLVTRGGMILNLTAAESDGSHARKGLDSLLERLPGAQRAPARWTRPATARPEAFTLPAKVNYVGKGADLYALGYRFHGSALVITRYLRNSWLWERVRVLGGAYGAFCLFDRLTGVLGMVSYRDPNLRQTLAAFDQAAGFLDRLRLDRQELTKAVIGAIGDLDAHLLPDAKGYASLLRFLTGDTEERRQKMRDEILGTRAADFRAFAEVLKAVAEKGLVKVLGSPDALKAFAEAYPGGMEVVRVL